MDRELSTEEIARSCYRLMASLMCDLEDWEGLAYEKQTPWIAVAARGPATLERMEGQPMETAAEALFALTVPTDVGDPAVLFRSVMPEDFRLRWQAVTRHLLVLIDCDDLRSPEESEAMWLQWYQKKIPAMIS